MPSIHTLGFRALFSSAVLLALWLALSLHLAGPARAAEIKLLCFGDSLVHGYGLAAADAFPEQLEDALDAANLEVEVINGGNSGDTTAAGRARLDWSLAERPDAVLVELGANDSLRGLDPEETYRNLDAILARLQAEGLPVLLVGMLAPRNLGARYTEAFDGVYPRLAEKYDVALYPFFLEGVALDPSLNQPDGIHPNAAGVAVIVERIMPAVVSLIEQASNKESADGGQ